ncbi:hypothetical protein [Filimonas lacunae]|nr:hypothetical protein [Filimonas lacunae]BAV07584.1 hypothetical protein FLA_3610 [Filimonas lacunae]
MKRTITIIALLFFYIAANAQTIYVLSRDRGITTELMRSTVATIVLCIICGFLLALTRIILNDQLKRKMLEKGVPVEVIANMLPQKNELVIAIKWFSVLMSISVGLLIICFTPPLGIHSILIMTVCVALGFLGFYAWAKRLKG